MTTLPNVNLPLATVGADDDAWGALVNAILTAFDDRIKSDGTGTAVGLKVDSGKTLDATGGTVNVTDSLFSIKDNSDATKIIKFEASGITTGTTRTLTAPNSSGTLALLGPGVSAYNANTQSLTSGAAAAQVVYDTENYDSAGYFASNVFTPLVAGKYRIEARALVSGTSVTSAVFSLYKNGSEVCRFFQFAGSATVVTLTGSEIVSFNGSTDYVEMKITVIGTGTLVVQNGVQRGNFCAEYVRP